MAHGGYGPGSLIGTHMRIPQMIMTTQTKQLLSLQTGHPLHTRLAPKMKWK